MLWTAPIWSLLTGGVLGHNQHVFTLASTGADASPIIPGANLATAANLSAVNADAYSLLMHPSFPGHRMRIKKSAFCDPTVNAYTGYLDVDYGAKHMFFYFFESRRDPTKDDVMMWINGGPGCSSASGLLMELGPCSLDLEEISSNGTVWNPYSWNTEANVFFLDQPVGVGFSYADYEETVETTEGAAKNVHAFISLFFDTFPEFVGRRLHLSGESYAGRYLPAFASYIVDQNELAVAQGRRPANLTSVIIGNGITDISTLYPGRYEVECGTAALEVPFQKISTCVRMKIALPRCQDAIKRNCVEQLDMMNCDAAFSFCDAELSTAYWESGRNVYDISTTCEENVMCSKKNTLIKEYLDRPDIRQLLGVDPLFNFTVCSHDVGLGFHSHSDMRRVPSQHHVAALLERSIRVLIYAGTYDWQCNWVANKLWVDNLDWTGKAAYAVAEWHDWHVDGKKAGETKSAGLLRFVTVRGAGHMVPHDKPAESQAMVSRWLAHQEL